MNNDYNMLKQIMLSKKKIKRKQSLSIIHYYCQWLNLSDKKVERFLAFDQEEMTPHYRYSMTDHYNFKHAIMHETILTITVY